MKKIIIAVALIVVLAITFVGGMALGHNTHHVEIGHTTVTVEDPIYRD